MCTYLPIHLSSTYSPFCLFTCLYVQMSAFSVVWLFTICPFTCLPIPLASCALVYTCHLSKFPSVSLTTCTSSPVLTAVDPPFCHCIFRRSIALCWLSDCQLSNFSPLCFHLSACQPVLLLHIIFNSVPIPRASQSGFLVCMPVRQTCCL